MFEKSLLEILTKEKEIIRKLETLRSLETDFLKMKENETDKKAIESCNRLSNRYKEEAKQEEKNLFSVRKEIKQYFSFLENL